MRAIVLEDKESFKYGVAAINSPIVLAIHIFCSSSFFFKVFLLTGSWDGSPNHLPHFEQYPGRDREAHALWAYRQASVVFF